MLLAGLEATIQIFVNNIVKMIYQECKLKSSLLLVEDIITGMLLF